MGKGGNKTPAAAAEQKLSGDCWDATKLSKEDEWIGKLDHEAFRKDVQDLGKKLAEQQGPADVAHLHKIVMWSRFCSYFGAATCWIPMLPVQLMSIFLMSCGTMSRWTIIGHHVCHGGFDKVDTTKRYNRFTFAVGSVTKRAKDWLDWMLVEAWNMEHNQLHHYHLGETTDPDLVEHNLAPLRSWPLPMFAKYLAVVWMACTWKWWYYAPNTYKQLKVNKLRREGHQISEEEAAVPCTIDLSFLLGGCQFFGPMEFFWKVLGPYFFVRFMLTPLPFLALDLAVGGNGVYAKTALYSLVFAEIATNIHSFIIIATNHAGDDLYRFNTHCTPRSCTFFLRQVISSVNYPLGTDLCDFMHGWLNYQIEHHLWPDLSMLSYQKAAPIMLEICKKHNVPYIKHNVFWRLKKLTDIMVNKTSMRKFPVAFEYAPDISEVQH